MRRYATVALMSAVLATDERPTIAQSISGSELVRTSFTSVREYVATDAIPAQLTAPPNVFLPDMYRPVLNTMLRHSPTFRRQSQRIAGEPGLTVSISVEPLREQSSIRAVTRLTREPNGRFSADIVIGARNNLVELIAHEFEHVIEQLDEVDLPALAMRPRTGVYERRDLLGSFETVRAKHVGRKVFAEFWRAS